MSSVGLGLRVRHRSAATHSVSTSREPYIKGSGIGEFVIARSTAGSYVSRAPA
jgi:hypothetical protein